MPAEYPMKPPDILLLTPNGKNGGLLSPLQCPPQGASLPAAVVLTSRVRCARDPSGRFETGTKICLSYTSFHAEEWQPAWGVRTMLDALVGIFPIDQPGIGSLRYTDAERRELAQKSRAWTCPVCNACMRDMFTEEEQRCHTDGTADQVAASSSTKACRLSQNK